MRTDDYPEVPGTLAVALALWAGAVALATRSDVFIRLAGEAYAALAAFAAVFAVAVVTMDPHVRGWLDLHGPLVGRVLLASVSVSLVAAGLGIATAGVANLAAAPWAPVLLFGLPVTVAAAIAALRAALQGSASQARRVVGMAGD